MLVAGVCLNLVRIYRPESRQTRSWKKVRKEVTNELNFPCGIEGWSTYNFTLGPIRVR